ncbi:MAG: DEAD/DEAH box helicase [Candidatus Methanomethylophilaceae archaeon]|nr:DEAD/DEAH box helicase [Candidatus Methanomethylophilaceae archaeon]
MSDYFEKLPWFIKEYVHNCRWSGFREIQTKTFEAFYSTDDHILISAGTSSGKTEAAMFPVIGSLYSNPPESIGALYVGPLKALINDQFERMGPVLGESELKITGWHGDISRSSKDRMVDDPRGILQITPESLQNILSYHPDEVERLFRDLRFVIIDEVHAFMDSDRGLQLLCCLQRLEVLAHCEPRRIGLSATIANREAAAEWLKADTGRRVSTVYEDNGDRRNIRIKYNYFPLPDPQTESVERKKAITSYYLDLFRETHGNNCIVFTNSRHSAEMTAKSLRIVSERKGYPDEVTIHHGSISKELRTIAEEKLKNPSVKNTTVATVTLELGIDVGDLDKIVQIDAPYTCSGLVQRMGRSGRRGNGQNLVLMCNEDEEEWWATLDGVSMSLIKAIAMSELILNEGWTEPAEDNSMPFGLLYHQTMEYLRPGIGAKFSSLVSDVLTMYPFRNITKEQYKLMIKHLVNLGHIEVMSDQTLLIGEKAERIVFNRDFCSVFTTKKEVLVKCDSRTVGSIQNMPQEDDLIQLAGRVWRVLKASKEKSMVEVEECDGEACNPWRSGTPPTHTRVMKKMLEVLESDTEYPYLDEAARIRLEESRATARSNGMTCMFSERTGGFRMYPWLGTKQFDTLRRVLQKVIGTDSIRAFQPYYIDIRTKLSEDQIVNKVYNYLENKDITSLIYDEDLLKFGKYDKFVPESLLVREYAIDKMDADLEL